MSDTMIIHFNTAMYDTIVIHLYCSYSLTKNVLSVM